MFQFYNLFKLTSLAIFIFFAVVILIPTDLDKQKNTLVYATYSDVHDWDPASAFSLEVLILANIYETLVYYDPENKDSVIQPALAKAWSVSDDGLVWTFKLRDNVYFHDGTELTAEVAKNSIERTIAMGKGGAYIWAPVESLEALDKLTLKITTLYPAPIDLIASSQYAAYIYSLKAAELGTDWFQSGNAAGTGPYKLRQWDRNQQIVIEQNMDYWKAWSENQISRVLFKIVRESATQVQMLLSGDADFVTLVPVDLINALDKNKNITVSYIPSWKNSQFLINTSKAPTDDLNFRKALIHAWDYQTVVDKIYEGSAEVARGIIPKTMWGHDESLSAPKFDLELAKKYLEASAVPNEKRKITISYISTSAAYQSAVELYQSNLSKIGISAEVKPGAWGTIWASAKSKNSAPNMISMTWWPTYPTPSDWLTGLFKTENPTNFNLSYYSNPEYDRLIEEGLKFEGSNRNLAINNYKLAQELLIKDAVAICYADLKERIIHSSKLSSFRTNPAYNSIFFYHLRKEN